MRRTVIGALLLLGAGAAATACNALTGVSDLCAGDCASLGGGSGIDGGGAGDAMTPAPDSGLPPTCSGNETACEGNVAAQCVSGRLQKTPCAETCVMGKCDSWPSCRNAAGAGCGAAGGSAGSSCCATANVPGGTFKRRNESSGGGGAASAATVSAFDLDKYEVTVGRMRAFVASGGGTAASAPAPNAGAHPKITGSGWHSEWNELLPTDVARLRLSFKQATPTWTDAAGANERLPINNVSWFVAFAFCAWDGGRLPTYAEADFAAAGGSEQRVYPWSSPPTDSTISSSRAAYGCGFTPPSQSCPASSCSDGSSSPCNAATCLAPNTCNTPPCTGCIFADIAPVGVLPAGVGRWGHHDLGGNMAELVLDVDGPLPAPCVDCAALPPTLVKNSGTPDRKLNATFLAVSGGWASSSTALRSSSFIVIQDDRAAADVGFRCAR